MYLRENIMLALEGLRANKMRALLTMLGIIIGIGSVIGISSMGSAMSKSFEKSLSKMGGKMIQVYIAPKDPEAQYVADNDSNITEAMIQSYKRLFPNELKSVGASVSAGTCKLDNLQKNEVKLTGANSDYMATKTLELLQGRGISLEDIAGERKVAVISDTLSKIYFQTEDSVGREMGIRSKSGLDNYYIVGVYKDPNKTKDQSITSVDFSESGSQEVFIPASVAENINGNAAKGYNYLSVIADKGIDSEAFSVKTKDFFNQKYYSSSEMSVKTENIEKYADDSRKMLSSLSMSIAVIAGISLLVGGIGVMNIMLVSVTERTREIGIRKALGARNGDIRVQFIVESIIICIIGGSIGVLVGAGIGALGGILIKTPVTPTLSSVLIAVLFSMGIGVFFGYYPANKAAKLDPIEALRYE